MAEYEVEIDDEFEVECPHPQCDGGVVPQPLQVIGSETATETCPVCEGTGQVMVWVEGVTRVNIEPRWA